MKIHGNLKISPPKHYYGIIDGIYKDSQGFSMAGYVSLTEGKRLYRGFSNPIVDGSEIPNNHRLDGAKTWKLMG